MYDLSEEQLAKLPQETLFDMVLLEVQMSHPNEKPLDTLALQIGVSTRLLYNVRAKKSHLTIESWAKIAALYDIANQWWRVNVRRNASMAGVTVLKIKGPVK